MKNLYRIGVNTFFDAVREPVYALMLAVGMLLILNYPAAALYAFREQIKMVTDSSMATILAFSFLIPVLISGAVVAKELRNGTGSMIFSKPLGRNEFLFGKIAGVTAASLFFAATLACAAIIALCIATDQFRFDLVVYFWSLFLILLSALIALAANFITGRPFPESFSFCAAAALAGQLCYMLIFSAHFEFEVVSTVKALLILLTALPIAATLAAVLALKFDTVPLLCIMMLLFIVGMMSDYLFGREAGTLLHRETGKILYGAVPNWQFFWVADALAMKRVIPWKLLFYNLLYSGLYSGLIIFWGMVLFRNSELSGNDGK